MNKLYIFIISLLVISTSLFSCSKDDKVNNPETPKTLEQIDLYVLAGQSNAQGWRCDAQLYPEDEFIQDKNIMFNYTFVDFNGSNGWITLCKQNGASQLGQQDYFGPEIMFARGLQKEKGEKIALFKFVKGATSIENDWKTPGSRGIYDRMTVELIKAIYDLEKSGYEPKIKGLVWIQGESDSNIGEIVANKYQNKLQEIINHFRTNIAKDENLKILLGVDEQFSESGVPIFIDKIVESQKNIANNDSNIGFTSMLGLPKADNTHLTSQGVIVQGVRVFDDFMNIGKIVNEKTYYKLKVKNLEVYNQIVEVGGFSIIDKTNIGFWEDYNLDNQKWILNWVDENYFWMEPAHAKGKCLDTNIDNAILYSYNNSDGQLWKMEEVEGDYFRLVNKANKSLFLTSENKSGSGANLFVGKFREENSQYFKFLDLDGNLVKPIK